MGSRERGVDVKAWRGAGPHSRRRRDVLDELARLSVQIHRGRRVQGARGLARDFSPSGFRGERPRLRGGGGARPRRVVVVVVGVRHVAPAQQAGAVFRTFLVRGCRHRGVSKGRVKNQWPDVDAGDGSAGSEGARRAGGTHVRGWGDVPDQVLLRHRFQGWTAADPAPVQREAPEGSSSSRRAASKLGTRASLDAATVVVAGAERSGRHPQRWIERLRHQAPTTAPLRRRARRVPVSRRGVRVGSQRVAAARTSSAGVAEDTIWPRRRCERDASTPAAARARHRARVDSWRFVARDTRGKVPSVGSGAGPRPVGLVLARARNSD
mmetsp:Transcript_2774/g.10896  ORF Transcript_2774/g.10896 Transcript_2774/m.10896 type:complete len:324 (+) Transcript_2774:1537-2508(+)